MTYLPRHIPSPTNPRISLHQEWSMRTAGYDDDARLSVDATVPLPEEFYTVGDDPTEKHTTFAIVVAVLGLEAAIRAVSSCGWMSESDWRPPRPDECVECLEVARA